MKKYLQSYGTDEIGFSNLITFLNREGFWEQRRILCQNQMHGGKRLRPVETSELGCGDDITVVMAYFTEE